MPSIKRATRNEYKRFVDRMESKRAKITGRQDIKQWTELSEMVGEIMQDVFASASLKALRKIAEQSEASRQNVCSLFDVSSIIPQDIQDEIDAIRFVNMAEKALACGLYVDVNKTMFYWKHANEDRWSALGY